VEELQREGVIESSQKENVVSVDSGDAPSWHPMKSRAKSRAAAATAKPTQSSRRHLDKGSGIKSKTSNVKKHAVVKIKTKSPSASTPRRVGTRGNAKKTTTSTKQSGVNPAEGYARRAAKATAARVGRTSRGDGGASMAKGNTGKKASNGGRWWRRR